MKIRERKIRILENQDIIVPLYRVLNNHEQLGISYNRYKYYSRTIEHHIYFLVKRLFKQIDANYDININSHKDRYLIDKINEIIKILESGDISFRISAKYLWINDGTLQLIDKQSYSNSSHHKEGAIERVDHWVYGGGYGLKELWQQLFDLLTFCETTSVLSPQQIIEYFYELKSILEYYGVKELRRAKLNAGKILVEAKQSIQLTKTAEYDQTKSIINTLNIICREGLVKPYTELFNVPKKATELLIQDYQRSRQLCLSQIKKDYHI